MKDIREIAENRILVLDGAMGTMIQRYSLEESDFRNNDLLDHSFDLKGNNDLLSVTRPDVIKEIHKAYLDAGADIIETNTFSSTSIAQADYGLDSADWIYKINYESAKIAKEVAEDVTARNPVKPRFVAGSIGPTNRTASLSPDVNDPAYRGVTYKELQDAYKLQVEALLDGGADLLLVETIFDTLNAKAALSAIEIVKQERDDDTPVMVSVTITDASGRTLSGQTTEAFVISVSHIDVFSLGLNCALGAKQLEPYLQILDHNTDTYTSAHPNAGLPNEFGQYDQTPEEMGEQIKEYLDQHLVNVIGGCCGTTPEHIRVISDLTKKYQPRKIKENVSEVV